MDPSKGFRQNCIRKALGMPTRVPAEVVPTRICQMIPPQIPLEFHQECQGNHPGTPYVVAEVFLQEFLLEFNPEFL